jgi:5-hydroxyisourate hydrolase
MTDRSHITTHVLDAATGSPAQGVSVELARFDGEWTALVSRSTDAQGRIADLGPTALEPGIYRLTFDTGDWFARDGRSTFYPRIDVTVEITATDEHYHVPILLSPFAFTTYRGS